MSHRNTLFPPAAGNTETVDFSYPILNRRQFLLRTAALAGATSLLTLPRKLTATSLLFTPASSNRPPALLKNSIGFNGQRQDPVTGLYHLGQGYRAYNPQMMRFHAADNLSPFGAGGFNPYSYCLGDPINLIDPTGHAGAPKEIPGISSKRDALIALAIVSGVAAIISLVTFGIAITPFFTAAALTLSLGSKIVGGLIAASSAISVATGIAGIITAVLSIHYEQKDSDLSDKYYKAALGLTIASGVTALPGLGPYAVKAGKSVWGLLKLLFTGLARRISMSMSPSQVAPAPSGAGSPPPSYSSLGVPNPDPFTTLSRATTSV